MPARLENEEARNLLQSFQTFGPAATTCPATYRPVTLDESRPDPLAV